MKIVINSCHGGFSLSPKAVKLYLSYYGKEVWPEESGFVRRFWLLPPSPERVDLEDSKKWNTLTEVEKKDHNEKYERQLFQDSGILRTDPYLVQVIEKLGTEADGSYAQLKIVEIPDDVEWEIQEYDGSEWVAEKHNTWS